MAEHRATIHWHGTSPDFLRGKYSREHTWSFDGGVSVPASSAPSVVPVPYSNPAAVDPEEAFVASISSCHMLSFLYITSKQGFEIESYADEAIGHMAKNEKGVPWVANVFLNPKIAFGGERVPSAQELEHLHHLAHEQCFIANSIKTEVKVNVVH
jgi:organic hydroperoxide reductase OsmC/OhrA